MTIAITLTVSATGCGGSKKNDSGEPGGVVKAYFAAVAAGDGAAACKLLAPAAAKKAAALGRPGSTCAKSLTAFLSGYPFDQKKLLRNAKVTKTTVKGTRATVTTNQGSPISLVRDAGAWRLDKPFG